MMESSSLPFSISAAIITDYFSMDGGSHMWQEEVGSQDIHIASLAQINNCSKFCFSCYFHLFFIMSLKREHFVIDPCCRLHEIMYCGLYFFTYNIFVYTFIHFLCLTLPLDVSVIDVEQQIMRLKLITKHPLWLPYSWWSPSQHSSSPVPKNSPDLQYFLLSKSFINLQNLSPQNPSEFSQKYKSVWLPVFPLVCASMFQRDLFIFSLTWRLFGSTGCLLGHSQECPKTWSSCEVTCRSRGNGCFTSCIILGWCTQIQVYRGPLWSQRKFLRPYWATLDIRCAFASAWDTMIMAAVFPLSLVKSTNTPTLNLTILWYGIPYWPHTIFLFIYWNHDSWLWLNITLLCLHEMLWKQSHERKWGEELLCKFTSLKPALFILSQIICDWNCQESSKLCSHIQ